MIIDYASIAMMIMDKLSQAQQALTYIMNDQKIKDAVSKYMANKYKRTLDGPDSIAITKS